MKWRPGYCLIIAGLITVGGSCVKEYSYEGAPFSAGYLVKDSNDNCSFIIVAGNYIVGRNLEDSNFLQVQVYANRKGHYTISSHTINGYSFNASGDFNDTGLVQVKMNGTGTPIRVETDLFTLQYDSSECTVKVIVADTIGAVATITNPDHFPLANADRWVYDDLSYPGDSVIKTITGTVIENSIQHYATDDYISFYLATNHSYYRKNG
ncbi:MAG: hypothetical protein ACRDE8_16170, partial [Ginsengibacter sp.]